MKSYGMDESGKGALVGPLTISLIGVSDSVDLPFEIRDSKETSPLNRKKILKERVPEEIYLSYIDPVRIDNYVYRKKLNILLFEEYCLLLNNLQEGSTVYIDSFYEKNKLKKTSLRKIPFF